VTDDRFDEDLRAGLRGLVRDAQPSARLGRWVAGGGPPTPRWWRLGPAAALVAAVVTVAVVLVVVDRDDDSGQQVAVGPATTPATAEAPIGPAGVVTCPLASGSIAFVRSTGPSDPRPHIVVLDAGCRVRQLTTDRSPVHNLGDVSWSPDGSRLAFTANDDVWTMDADGSNQRELVGGIGSIERGPTWSPDGRRLAFYRIDDGGSGIWTVDPDGGSARRLTTEDDRYPAWSPDGTRIAFARDPGEIYVMNADGSRARKLTTLGFSQDRPTWSPDGHQIAFRHNNTITVANADGTGVRQLAAPPPTRIDRPPGSGTPTTPAWSPDGATIAYSLLQSGDHCGIWLMNADGSGQRPLTDGSTCDREPAWRPAATGGR
jgi:Tol biopolymer transport system component